MPSFTIESTYRLPVFRQRAYEAATIDDACRVAIEDSDWTGQKEDYESCGPTYVTGVWPGIDTAYMVRACSVPTGFARVNRRPSHKVPPIRWRHRTPFRLCRVVGIAEADICRDANACWHDAAPAWSLLATYGSQTCARCGADSNNLSLWVSVLSPGSAAAFRWDVI